MTTRAARPAPVATPDSDSKVPAGPQERRLRIGDDAATISADCGTFQL